MHSNLLGGIHIHPPSTEREAGEGHAVAKDRCHIVRRKYTSRMLRIHTFNLQKEYYGKEVIVADREMVESQVDAILHDADKEDVAFLVVGDPFG